MMYDFKRAQELLWFGGVAVAGFVLLLLADFDPDTVQDWRTYFVAAGAGAARAFAAAILAKVKGS